MGCCESNNPKAKVKPVLNNNTSNYPKTNTSNNTQTQVYKTNDNNQIQTYNTYQVNGVNQVIKQNGFNINTVSNVTNGNFMITQFQTTTATTQNHVINIFDDDDDEDFREARKRVQVYRNGIFPTVIQINQKKQEEENLEDLINLDKSYSFTAFQKESLNRHNYYRRMHHVCDLQLSDELCEKAQNYAEYLVINDKFEHSYDKFKGKSMGENLHWQKGSKPDGNEAVDCWYNEIEDYDFETGESKNGNKVGHLTQLLWKESKYLGVGIAEYNGAYVVVANYFPTGNYVGHYTENVFPK